MVLGELIDDPAALERLAGEWDELAVACAKPYCAPAWMLAWWRHVAPRGGSLRAVAVRDGTDLVALAPLYASSPAGITRYRVLGHGTSYRTEPLALPQIAPEAAAVTAEVLSRAAPRPDAIVLEGVSEDCRWPDLLRDGWPGRGRTRMHLDRTTDAPILSLAGRTFDSWLESRSKHFRAETRRLRRRLEEKGAVFRMAEDVADVDRFLSAFADLHRARWRDRGESKVLDRRVEAMVADAASILVPSGRLRLWYTAVEDRIVSADVMVAAGGEVSGWLGGFDPDWTALAPSTQAMLEAIHQAFDSGDRRFDLGGGEHEYKRRWAEDRESLSWYTIVPPGPRGVLTTARLAPRRAYRTVANRLRPETKERIRRRARGAYEGSIGRLLRRRD